MFLQERGAISSRLAARLSLCSSTGRKSSTWPNRLARENNRGLNNAAQKHQRTRGSNAKAAKSKGSRDGRGHRAVPAAALLRPLSCSDPAALISLDGERCFPNQSCTPRASGGRPEPLLPPCPNCGAPGTAPSAAPRAPAAGTPTCLSKGWLRGALQGKCNARAVSEQYVLEGRVLPFPALAFPLCWQTQPLPPPRSPSWTRQGSRASRATHKRPPTLQPASSGRNSIFFFTRSLHTKAQPSAQLPRTKFPGLLSPLRAVPAFAPHSWAVTPGEAAKFEASFALLPHPKSCSHIQPQ